MAQNESARGLLAWGSVVLGALLACSASSPVRADIDEDLTRIDEALRTNPSRVLPQALNSCMMRRRYAIELWNMGQPTRAERSLSRCFTLLDIPKDAPQRKVRAVPTPEDLQAKARVELERALELKPDLANGLDVYRTCAACHRPEGWGLANGSVPQIAGQHPKVVIKQLADIRAGNRDAVLMVPYASVESIGGAQAVADVAAYIDTLEISIANDKGPGDSLVLGERLYRENCARCHGGTGEGNNETYAPRIQAQHFRYLRDQFEAIRDGKRHNANPDMVSQIQNFGEKETNAVLDYVSRLEPPEALQAPKGWKNPDFQD